MRIHSCRSIWVGRVGHTNASITLGDSCSPTTDCNRKRADQVLFWRFLRHGGVDRLHSRSRDRLHSRSRDRLHSRSRSRCRSHSGGRSRSRSLSDGLWRSRSHTATASIETYGHQGEASAWQDIHSCLFSAPGMPTLKQRLELKILFVMGGSH